MVTAYRNVRGKLKATGSPLDPLYVIVDGISVTNFSVYGFVLNVPDNTVTTILTQSYVANTFENLVMVSVSGEDYAKYFLVINGSNVDIRRSGPDRNLTFDFTGAPISLMPGDIVDIKVEHFFVGSLLKFDATIYGYDG